MRANRSVWNTIQRELQIWRSGALPGLAVIGLVALLRLTGALQMSEWMALDSMLRLRPAEPIDEDILIVGIDEEDIQEVGQYPIPDGVLAQLIQTLSNDEPAVIGLDIFRDLPQKPGHAELEQIFQTTPNLIGIDKVGSPKVAAPPALPDQQVGFADLLTDLDGKLRRSLLGTYRYPDPPTLEKEEFRFSFSFLIAELFLEKQNIFFEPGIEDPYAFRFGATEIPRIDVNTGGYRNASVGEVETLINFRSGDRPFRVVSLRQVLAGEVSVEQVRDRIVLIGVVAPSVKDSVNSVATTSVVPNSASGIVYGVEIQAHAISQIVQAALHGRPLLRSWSEGWEYIWIITWGLVGISLGRLLVTPWRFWAGLGTSCVLLFGLCYGLLLLGWWVPLFPAMMALFLNGVGLTASSFYQYQQNLKVQLRARQTVIEQTFDAIHNGPLQTLSWLLSKARSDELEPDHLRQGLERLNDELREVYDAVRREVMIADGTLYLTGEQTLDLTHPFDEVLYEVYRCTLSREFPGFKTINVIVPDFKALDTTGLTLEHKRRLCRFLEEALCNVGKYAIDATRLDIACTQKHGWNMIRVVDNGKGANTTLSTLGGRGTQQAIDLARQLGGTFRRDRIEPHGTICELKWKPARLKFWQRWLVSARALAGFGDRPTT